MRQHTHDISDASEARRHVAPATPPGGVDSPPTGNTGGISPNTVRYDRRAVSCHWLRVIHPEQDRARVRDQLVEFFGEPDQVRGRWFYEHGERFKNGVLLLWGATVGVQDDEEGVIDDGATCCIDIPGSAIDDIEPAERFGVLRDLSIGGRVSRIDLAADAWHAERVGLIDAAIGSCKAGELCGARRWSPRYSYDGESLDGYGVCIGERGNNGSGRYVRVYDKGLESETLPAGQWERFEAEFSGDCASEVAIDVFCAGGDWEARMWSRINGAVSFREVGASNGELARRPYCPWWAEWIGGSVPCTTIMRRVETTLERHTRWLTDTVLPTVARLAADVRVSFTDALYRLCGPDVKPRKVDKYMRVMLAEWRDVIKDPLLIPAT